jgi:sulfide:quinone oxidoreductase
MGARVVVLGAGIAGHTASAFLRRWLGKEHQVVVVSPRPDHNWVPSNIWVGVGLMRADQVLVPLAPLCRRRGIDFRQARALAIHPEGSADSAEPFVDIEHTGEERNPRMIFIIGRGHR